MEYSLQKLNENFEVKFLLKDFFIEKLNLIGFEIDQIKKEKDTNNEFLDNTKIIIKIPANRQDILVEKFFQHEISSIFLIKVYYLWENIKKTYFFLLKKKYFQNYNYKSITIDSTVPEILLVNISVKNFTTHFSPRWIQKKLINSGHEVKNNFQDILKLINLEWGVPFSFSVLPIENLNKENESTIFTKLLKKKENEKEYIVLKTKKNSLVNTFNDEDFLPTDKEIKNITIQTFYYDIDETNLNLGIPKFSVKLVRKNYLQNLKNSWQRLLTLLELIYEITIDSQIYSTRLLKIVELKSTKILKLRLSFLKIILNLPIVDFKIFEKAGLKIICKTPREIYLEIPYFRKDLNREIDLVEEYSRFVEYNNFDDIFPKKDFAYSKRNNENINFIKQYFLIHGFNEIQTNSFDDNKKQTDFSIVIKNPLTTEFGILRSNLLSKLLDSFEKNLRLSMIQKNFFEIGRVFEKSEKKLIEQQKIAGIFHLPSFYSTEKSISNWFIAKGFLENFLQNFGYFNITCEKLPFENPYFHLTKSIIIKQNNEVIGFFGEINPKLENLKHKKFFTYIFELNLHYLQKWRMNSSIRNYKEYSKYPSIIKDFSFLTNSTINFSNLKQMIKENSKNLKSIKFFDIYSTKKNNISIGIRLEFQSFIGTLIKEEIETSLKTLQELVKLKFDIDLKN